MLYVNHYLHYLNGTAISCEMWNYKEKTQIKNVSEIFFLKINNMGKLKILTICCVLQNLKKSFEIWDNINKTYPVCLLHHWFFIISSS